MVLYAKRVPRAWALWKTLCSLVIRKSPLRFLVYPKEKLHVDIPKKGFHEGWNFIVLHVERVPRAWALWKTLYFLGKRPSLLRLLVFSSEKLHLNFHREGFDKGMEFHSLVCKTNAPRMVPMENVVFPR